MTATNAHQIADAARDRARQMADALYPQDFVDHQFYLDLRNAYLTAKVKVTDGNTVAAWVFDRRFQYVASTILDVDTAEEIFTNGHIEDDGPRGAKFLLRCPCHDSN